MQCLRLSSLQGRVSMRQNAFAYLWSGITFIAISFVQLTDIPQYSKGAS